MPEASLISASRPAIAIDGQDKPELAEGLLGLSIAENTQGLYRCELTIGNWGNRNNQTEFLYFDRKLLDFGKALQVKIGQDTAFDGRITALEAHFLEARPPELTVLAEDRFQDLRMTRRTRSFVDSSDADVMDQVASDHGLSPDISVTGPTYKVLAQVNQSDLAFLRDRARTIDAELWMEGSKLRARSRSARNGDTLRLTFGNQLQAFSVAADLAGQCTSVTVNGWDIASKEGLQHEATDSVITGELNGDASGVSLLQSKFGARKQSLAHTVPLNSQEAQAEAETFFKRSARRFVTGRGVADAGGKLRVGAFVDLQGLGLLFSGKYYVSESRVLWDLRKGLRTEFTGERLGIGKAN
jgi:phage protein D